LLITTAVMGANLETYCSS